MKYSRSNMPLNYQNVQKKNTDDTNQKGMIGTSSCVSSDVFYFLFYFIYFVFCIFEPWEV